MPHKKGWKRSKESVNRMVASQKAGRDRLGSQPKKRKEEPDYQGSSGYGDSDYILSLGKRRSPRLFEDKPIWGGKSDD